MLAIQVKTSKMADRFRGLFTRKKKAEATDDKSEEESKGDDSMKEAQVIDDGFMPASDKSIKRSFSTIARDDDLEDKPDDDGTMKLDKE